MDNADFSSTPFLKWAGGKRWLAPAVVALARSIDFNRYYEPFVGGGAVYFELRPRCATLADLNSDLINVYRQVRWRPAAIARQLSLLPIDPSYFNEMRSSRPALGTDRAVRFLYLNRTAFNGLYRVNQRGTFNVPYGCKLTTRFPDETTLRSVSRALRDVTFIAGTFVETLRRIRRHDFVYLDPPYTVKHDQNGFLRYNESLFMWSDQEQLAASALRLARRGVFVIMSNAHHEQVRKLYCACHFMAFRVSRPSNMASSPISRGVAHELLVVSRTVTHDSSFVRKIIAKHVTVRATPLHRRCERE